MTDEEKADNIVIDIKLSAIKDSINGRKEQTVLELIKQSVLKMAEWKNKQFKEYLEKKKAELPSSNIELDSFEIAIIIGKESILDDIIYELSKKEIEK